MKKSQPKVVMTPSQRTRFARMWAEGTPLAEIADRMGFTFGYLARWRRKLGLPPRYGNLEPPPPTLQEIERRKREVESGWTFEQFLKAGRGK